MAGIMSEGVDYAKVTKDLYALSKSRNLAALLENVQFPAFSPAQLEQIRGSSTSSFRSIINDYGIERALPHAPNDILRKTAQHAIIWTPETTDAERYEDLYACKRGLEEVRHNYALFWGISNVAPPAEDSVKSGIDLLRAFKENAPLPKAPENADVIHFLGAVEQYLEQVLTQINIPEEEKAAIQGNYNALKSGRDTMAAIDPGLWA